MRNEGELLDAGMPAILKSRAEIAPGDVLFYPTLRWHHVEALDSFNARRRLRAIC